MSAAAAASDLSAPDAVMLTAALVVFGLVSYPEVGIDLFPSVDFSVGAERDKIVVLARPELTTDDIAGLAAAEPVRAMRPPVRQHGHFSRTQEFEFAHNPIAAAPLPCPLTRTPSWPPAPPRPTR